MHVPFFLLRLMKLCFSRPNVSFSLYRPFLSILTVSLTSWSDPLLLLVSALRAGAVLVLSLLQQWEVSDWTAIAT